MQPTRHDSNCVPAMPLSWWAARTRLDRRRFLLLRRDGAYTWWSVRTVSRALWHDTYASELSRTPTLRFYSVMRSGNSRVRGTWSELPLSMHLPASVGLS